MTLTSETSSQESSHLATDWEERQRRFESQQAAFLQERAAFQQHRYSLHKQRASLEQERLLFEQERLQLWKDLQERWQSGEGGERRWNNLCVRMQMRQDFFDELTCRRQRFSAGLQAFQQRLAVLRDQRAFLRELSDRSQQREGFRQVQASYLELQQELLDYRQFLSEQQAGYSQLRLDYEAEQRHIQGLKSAIWPHTVRRDVACLGPR